MNLLVFNPEHDYALAHNDEHFMALQSAVQFAQDCAPFMHYLFKGEDNMVFCPYVTPNQDLSFVHPENIYVWGWDKVVGYQMRQAGLAENYLPAVAQMEKIRELSHRKMSIAAMDYLRQHCPHLEIPCSAVLLEDISQVGEFIAVHPDAIFKSPYSGNGRGNLYAHGKLTPTLERQCKGVIRRQGSLLAEPLYPVVQDFAMEFSCAQNQVRFAGYSLFETRFYGYAGNVLCSDSDIERKLNQWVSTDRLVEIRENIQDFLRQNILPYYEGCVGVDMFVYDEDGVVKVNPMVEINLRMTMGMAAHTIYEYYVHPHAKGTMRIEYRANEGELFRFLSSCKMMETLDGKWRSGIQTLTPVSEKTRYAVVVSLE